MQNSSENLSFQTTKQAAELLGISPRRIRKLASEGRIVGAYLHQREGWLIPSIVNIKPGKRGPDFTAHRKKHSS